MPEINQEGTPQPEVVSTNWDALEKDYSNTPLTQEKPAEQKTEPAVEEKTIVDEVAKTEDTKTEPKVEEKKPEDVKDEKTKTEEVKTEEKPVVEFKVEDILTENSLAPEGTFLRLAQDLKIEGVTEDSWEAFDKARTAPLLKEIETLKLGQKVDYLATLKPETATNLKLLEMGIPEEQLFAPTKEIESYLKLDNAQLVRADLEALGWKTEMIDTEMELLTSKNLIDHQAEKIRLTLNETKNEILQERTQLVQQFESQKEAAVLKQKEQEFIQFEQALNTASKFMDNDVSPDIKKAILTKYRNGGYDNDFSSAKAKVELIYHKELGTQMIKAIRNTEFNKGLEKVTKELLNVPPVTNTTGSKVETNNQSNDNWAAIEKDFGIK